MNSLGGSWQDPERRGPNHRSTPNKQAPRNFETVRAYSLAMASLTAVARRASSQLRRPQILAPSAWATGSTIQRRSFRSNDLPTFKSLQDEFELEDIEEFEGDDATGLGHLILRQQREYLNLFRKIELEVPQLKGARLVPNKGSPY